MSVRCATWGAVLWLTAVLAAQPTPRIHVTWQGQPPTLNVSVTNLPPFAAVEVEVRDLASNRTEKPNGKPPAKADAAGHWPGEHHGGRTGYPGTANAPAGTRYTVSVRVNGKTGPSVGVTKPKGRPWWQYLLTLGLLWLGDQTGVTQGVGRIPAPEGLPAAA